MADVGEWVYSKLTNHAGTSAIVATRVYPVRLPQSATFPAATYQQVSGYAEHAMGADSGVFRATFQVTSWAESFSAARALALQVKSCLRRATGTTTPSTVTVQNTLMEMEIDAYEDGTQRYRVDQDYLISYEES